MRLPAITGLIFVLSFLGATVGEDCGAEEFAREKELAALEYQNEGADSVFGNVAELSRKADPEGKGVNIIYDEGRRRAQDHALFAPGQLLRRHAVHKRAGLHFRIDESAVVICDK